MTILEVISFLNNLPGELFYRINESGMEIDIICPEEHFSRNSYEVSKVIPPTVLINWKVKGF